MKVCLFAHYDPRHRVRPHVVDYISALRSAGFNVVMACSGDFRPPTSDLAPLKELGVEVVWRANAGLDFGAWRDLIRRGYADGASAVLLANDSVFGPFGDLGPIVQRMCERGYDAWGMVESWQSGWHLQSWFLYLSRHAFSLPGIRAVLDQPFETMSKGEIIKKGELALGRALRAEGLKCGAVNRRIIRRVVSRLVATNPMHLDWRYLVLSGTVPFIKAELVRENGMSIPWAGEWSHIISTRLGYETGGISAFLHDYVGDDGEVRSRPFAPPEAALPWNILLRYVLASADWHTAVRYIPAYVRLRRESVLRKREAYHRATALL